MNAPNNKIMSPARAGWDTNMQALLRSLACVLLPLSWALGLRVGQLHINL